MAEAPILMSSVDKAAFLALHGCKVLSIERDARNRNSVAFAVENTPQVRALASDWDSRRGEAGRIHDYMTKRKDFLSFIRTAGMDVVNKPVFD